MKCARSSRPYLRPEPAALWERQLSDAGIPCGMVREVSEAVNLDGLDERGVKIPLHVPGLPDKSDVQIVNAGFKYSQDSPHIDQPPPRHGEHSDAILESLGFDAADRREILAGNISDRSKSRGEHEPATS